jgi:hypothetical protein
VVRKIAAILIASGWFVYIGLTGYVLWLVYMGQTPLFLKEYSLGTNAGWIMIGVMLWVATERFREFSERS